MLQERALWRQPHQPHPGTQCSRCGCCLPALTRFTGNRCGGTDGVTITTPASRQAGPLYRSHRKLQPLGPDKKIRGFKYLPASPGATQNPGAPGLPTMLATRPAPATEVMPSRHKYLHSVVVSGLVESSHRPRWAAKRPQTRRPWSIWNSAESLLGRLRSPARAVRRFDKPAHYREIFSLESCVDTQGHRG